MSEQILSLEQEECGKGITDIGAEYEAPYPVVRLRG